MLVDTAVDASQDTEEPKADVAATRVPAWSFTIPRSLDEITISRCAYDFMHLGVVSEALSRPRIKPEVFNVRERLIVHAGIRTMFDGEDGFEEMIDQDIVDALAWLWRKAERNLTEMDEKRVFALLNEANWHHNSGTSIIDELFEMLPETDDADASNGPFIIRKSGVYYRATTKDGTELEPQWVCSPLAVVARTRDHLGEAWGRLVEVHDSEGTVHTWAMPARLLAGGSEVFEELLSMGLTMDNSLRGRQRVNEFLTRTDPGVYARCVQRVGWHGQGQARRFVLPDAAFGPKTDERVVLQADTAGHAFRVSGSLPEWKEAVGRFCPGNSRLVLAVSAALAAPLLDIAGVESGGIHLFGPSSTGKSTALKLAASLWGGGGASGYLNQWRATSNGIEGLAARHCDCLLALDELGQADPQTVGEAAYMLSNGQGKARASKDGSTKKPQEWRLLFLSSGEVTLETRMREDRFGSAHKAGQGVRVLDLPACPEGGHGLFEALHGFASGDALARHLGEATAKFYGTPVRAFLEALAAKPMEAETLVREAIRRFCEAHTPPGADGQVSRVAARFGLIAAAGELGIRMDVLPWPPGEALRAAAACFLAWLDQRGTSGPQEIDRGVRQVCRWFQANHMERLPHIDDDPFQAGDDLADGDGGEGAPKTQKYPRVVRNVAGYHSLDGLDAWEFWLFPETFREEVCKGFDNKALTRELIKRGMLKPDSQGKSTTPTRIPGSSSKVRMVRFTAAVLGGPDAEDDEQAPDDATEHLEHHAE